MYQNILTGLIVQKNETTTLNPTFFPSVKHIHAQCSQLSNKKSPASAWDHLTIASFTHHCRIETTSPYLYSKFSHCGRPTLQYSPNCVIYVNYNLLSCETCSRNDGFRLIA